MSQEEKNKMLDDMQDLKVCVLTLLPKLLDLVEQEKINRYEKADREFILSIIRYCKYKLLNDIGDKAPERDN
jgi:hypothetical protein